jgi:hypothetical protein
MRTISGFTKNEGAKEYRIADIMNKYVHKCVIRLMHSFGKGVLYGDASS